MKKVAGKTKDISCHQKSKNTKYYFFGDGQSFEEIQDFASHALMLSVNAVLLFRVLSAADSRSSRFGACLYRCVVHSFALNGRKNKVTCISCLQPYGKCFRFTPSQVYLPAELSGTFASLVLEEDTSGTIIRSLYISHPDGIIWVSARLL